MCLGLLGKNTNLTWNKRLQACMTLNINTNTNCETARGHTLRAALREHVSGHAKLSAVTRSKLTVTFLPSIAPAPPTYWSHTQRSSHNNRTTTTNNNNYIKLNERLEKTRSNNNRDNDNHSKNNVCSASLHPAGNVDDSETDSGHNIYVRSGPAVQRTDSPPAT